MLCSGDFLGRFRVERLIHESRQSVLYEVSPANVAPQTAPKLPEQLAAKVLSAELSKNFEMHARFCQEARILAHLLGPHIPDVVDFGRSDAGEDYLIMELLEGESLGARARRSGPLPLSEVAAVLDQAAAALQSVHDRGVLHRNLRPDHLFLCRRSGRTDDEVKVLDFFWCAAQKGVAVSRGALPVAQFGTAYTSPELATAGVLDARSDVYSMGAVLFSALAGQPPFSADSTTELLARIVQREPPPLRSLRADLPGGVEEVLGRALAKAPGRRFDSMLALREAFRSALE
jgi:eukaryotic-like serine/threonine-protein kinase